MLIINYDIKKINAVLLDFYNATGIDMEFLKTDFSPVGNRRLSGNRYCMAMQSNVAGRKACSLSDMQLLEKCRVSKKTEMHICHAGLVNVAIPLLYDDVIIGYIIFGRMKPNTDFTAIKDYIAGLGINADKAAQLYDTIPIYKSDIIQSVSNIAIMLAKYILLKNMIKPDLNDNIQKAVDYINNNLESDLSVKSISKNANVSKSVLYKNFHTSFNCTVSEYIHARRVEKSLELLTGTDMSIEEISQKVGFSSASYYSKIFKKQMGVVPVRYRKTSQYSE